MGAADDDAIGAEAEDDLCGGVTGTRTVDDEPEAVAGGAGGEDNGGAVNEDAGGAVDEALAGLPGRVNSGNFGGALTHGALADVCMR